MAAKEIVRIENWDKDSGFDFKKLIASEKILEGPKVKWRNAFSSNVILQTNKP